MDANDPPQAGDMILVQGVEIPPIGLGTWDLRGTHCRRVVAQAIELGYRHIDTAEMYGNEAEIGQAMREAGVPRRDMFLVSKLWTNHAGADQVEPACRESLEKLGCEYLDLYLLHWPVAGVPIQETVEALADLQAKGLTRWFGVSNFTVQQLEEAEKASTARLLCDQVRFNPWHGQPELVAYCGRRDLLLTAYTPVAKGRTASDPVLVDIGRKYGKTGTQVALRWLTQKRNVVAIPKASQVDHLRENLGALDFQLDAQEMAQIDQLSG
jgi:2,5-diketo-D-gluconate reductase B